MRLALPLLAEPGCWVVSCAPHHKPICYGRYFSVASVKLRLGVVMIDGAQLCVPHGGGNPVLSLPTHSLRRRVTITDPRIHASLTQAAAEAFVQAGGNPVHFISTTPSTATVPDPSEGNTNVNAILD